MIVKKRENKTEGIENIIISLYAKGMSNSDIEEQTRELYGFNISRITGRITKDVITWRNRPLEATYLIVWMDGILFKVRENSKLTNKTIYIAVGLRTDGKKEALGLRLGKKTIFPNSTTQICVVHQIGNSYRYVVWKDKKEFTHNVKHIYTAPTKEASKAALTDFKTK